MVSDRDLGPFEVTRLLTEDGADALRRRLSLPIVQVMSTDVVIAEPDTEMSDLIALLLEYKVGALPVIAAGTRQIVGIISYIDVLRAVEDLLEVE